MADTVDLAVIPADNPLSEREMEVARLLAMGLSNAEIARDLIISPHTVKVHLRNIFEKLHVNSRTEASLVLMQRGWLVVPGVEVAAATTTPAPPPPPPEPAPLADTLAQVQLWQRVYLLGALVLSLLLALLPNLASLARTPTNLLTDANQPAAAPSLVRNEPRWELRTPLQQPASRLAMVAHDKLLYVLGGETTGGTALADAAVYNMETNEWSPIAPMPIPLANLAAAALGDRIYVAGGSTGSGEVTNEPQVTNAFLAYTPATDSWTQLPPLPVNIAGAALAADDASLYLAGGWDGREMSDDIWQATFAAGQDQPTWARIGHLLKARAFLGAVVVDGELFAVGGYDGERELDLAEAFAPSTGTLRQLPPLGTSRGGLALVHDGLTLFALGGGWTHPISTHERYDSTLNAWSNFPSPVQGEWRNLAAAAQGDQIHLVGGWSGSYLDKHLQYQSSFRALLPVIITD